MCPFRYVRLSETSSCYLNPPELGPSGSGDVGALSKCHGAVYVAVDKMMAINGSCASFLKLLIKKSLYEMQGFIDAYCVDEQMFRYKHTCTQYS